ncbi:MAG TPA: hypothetical protein VIH57_09325 [Bacteroidales bacterium]
METHINSIELYHKVTESIKKNLHLLDECDPARDDIDSLVGFNNRIVLSGCKAFLEAVKSEIGGEIIDDSRIGTFLYYGEVKN